MLAALGETEEALHFVFHITEAAGLSAVAINGQVFAAQRLFHEVGDHAAVIQLHTRAVSIEDAHDARVHAVVAVVSHGHGFGKTLGLVINRARTDGIDVAPISLFLRMLQRVPVTLGRGSKQIFGVVLTRNI